MGDKSIVSTLYDKAREHVLKSITLGKYSVGEVLPPAELLATKLSCSTGTIRNVLTDLAQEGVLKRVQRKGTVVARRPSTGRVCLWLSNDAHTNLIYQDALLRTLVEQGYWVDLVPTAMGPEATAIHCRKLLSDPEQSDALALLSPHPEILKVAEEFAPRFRRRALVQIDNRNPLPNSHLITLNHLKAAKDVVEHLLKLGHRKIAIVAGLSPRETSFAAEASGYCRDFMEVAGGQALPFYIGGNSKDLLVKWIREEGVTAYWGITDHEVMQTINQLTAAGLRVPEDVSLIGRNDTPWAVDSVPMLTSVSLNPQATADALVASLERMASHSPPIAFESVTKIDPILVVRESTGPAQGVSSRRSARRRAG